MNTSLRDGVKRVVDPRVYGALRRLLPSLTPELQQAAMYYPHKQGARSYSRVLPPTAAGSPLPVPPPGFWAGYGTSPDGYLASGREDCEMMRKLLAASGAPIENAARILDLGCAGGRMIRHLEDLTAQGEVWGCDIWGDAIAWCQGHLSPPFRFATTTAAPHLPFADGYFGLAYCGSLFTHIDDLAEAWWLELNRVIHPGGRLLFSVNDRSSVRIFAGEGDPAAYPRFHERVGGAATWDAFVSTIHADPEYLRFRDGQAWMVSMNRDGIPHVMWDADVLCDRLAYGWRRCSVTPEGYGHQTLVLLERA